MVDYKYTDLQGRKITQTAYESQKAAGTDVSGYKPIETQPAPTVSPVVQPVNQMEQIKQLPQYQELLNKGYKPEDIEKAVSSYEPPKQQVQPQAEIKPATETISAEQTTIQPQKQEEITPTKVEQPKTEQTPLTPLPLNEYKDDSETRQTQIVNNLNAYRQSSPTYMKDLDTFRKTFSYGLRSDTQRNLLDNWYLGYQKGLELNGKNVNDISSLYTNGSLSDTDMEQLKLQNPTKYSEVMGLVDKKTTLAKYDTMLNGTKEVSPMQSIIENWSKNMLSMATAPSNMFEEYKNEMNNEEMKKLQSDLVDKEGQILQLDEQINKIRRNVENTYAGKGVAASKINAIIQDETWKLQEARNTLAIDYGTLAKKYNNQMTSIKDTYDMKIKEQEYNNTQRSQQMQEMGFMMNLMNFETNAQKDERERQKFIRQQEYQDGNIYSSDPVIRNKAIEKAVDRVLTEFEGIPMVRSREQMVTDIKNMVANGKELGEAITQNIRNPIMNKPEYQTWKNKKLGIDTTKNIVTIGSNQYLVDENGNLSNLNIPLSQQQNISFIGSGMAGAGLRNNNPGNIKDDTFGSPIGRDNKGFTQFSTPEDGFDALVEKIKYNQTNTKSAYYGKNILQYFQKYAPSSDGNNPINYANSVAKNLGVSVNTPISQLDPIKFAAQIAKHDSGYDYSTYGQFRGKTSITPTASELAYFSKGALGIDPKGIKGITQQRYNEIAQFKQQEGKETGKGIYNATEMQSLELPEKATEFTKKSFGYANRLAASNENITDYENKFIERSVYGQKYQELTPERAKSDIQKSYELYKENFITANLRQESGAAIAPSEFTKEEKKYFALPGDSKEVVEQKRKMRELAIKNMYISAGSDVNGIPISSYYKYGNISEQQPQFDISSWFTKSGAGSVATQPNYQFNLSNYIQ